MTMNMELLKVNRWDLQHIEERTKQMISEICNLYPYPNVKVASVDEDDDVVDEKEALEIAIKAVGEQLETIKKGACYKSG